MDAEDDGDLGESPWLVEPTDCITPGLLCQTAKTQGITCQKVFERVYMRDGQTESFARAMFVRFCVAEDKEHLVPAIVREYCDRAQKMGRGTNRSRTGFCMGCMMAQKGWFGLTFSYNMIHPEVTEQLLRKQATNGKAVHTPTAAEIPQLSEEEKLWLDLQDSGALDDDTQSWDSLMRGGDDF